MSLNKACGKLHMRAGRYVCDCPWRGDITIRGERFKKSFGRGVKKDILPEYEEFLRLCRKGEYRKAATEDPRTVDDLFDLYIKHHVESKGLAYKGELEYKIGVLRREFGPLRIEAFMRPGPLMHFIERLKAEGRKPATLNRYRATVKSMVRWANAMGYTKDTPFDKGLNALDREDNARSRRLSADEERLLLKAAGSEMMRARIMFSIDTGVRRGELLKLQVQHVNFSERTIDIPAWMAKSRKARRIPLDASNPVWAFLEQRRFLGPEARVFGSPAGERTKDVRAGWAIALKNSRALAREEGLDLDFKDLHWHDLRHEFGSRLGDARANPAEIRDLMGHASITTTNRYMNTRLDQLRETTAKLKRG